MELYGALASPYVARVILFARLKGIDLPPAEVPGGWSGSPEYKALSPIGKIPALNVDGQCIPESETICEYLEDTYPDTPGLPADAFGRAQSRTISRIVDLYMSPISSELARQVNPEKRGRRRRGKERRSLRNGLDLPRTLHGRRPVCGRRRTNSGRLRTGAAHGDVQGAGIRYL